MPLLVLLPLIEGTQVLGQAADVGALAASAFQSLAVLAAILVGGRVVLRRVFAAVAGANSNETCVASRQAALVSSCPRAAHAGATTVTL